MKLLIFDIDGTLTHLDGATTRAYTKGFERAFNTALKTGGLSMHGRTDPLIFRECFQHSGLSGNWEESFDLFKVPYLEELPLAIKESSRAHLHPGIPELLAKLAALPEQFALALGTGNIELGGRAKVGYFNLNHYFPVGGFGDVHPERHMILRDAVSAARAHFNCDFDPAQAWVIGDTNFDVEGGQKIGAKTLGVATGGKYSEQDLRLAGADAVYADLADTDAIIELFARG
ncbi:HAD family hydrolase [bacterium]|nr:HAD family hydrolase [bacterium]